MRKILIITITATFLLFSCKSENRFDEFKNIVLTGIIHNYKSDNAKLYILYSLPGSGEIRDTISISKEGSFRYSFSGYVPLDAMILEKRTFANINFIYHPGDSIHLEFDAFPTNNDLLKSVTFTGDNAETNNNILKFQILREENNLGYGVLKPDSVYKLDIDHFSDLMERIKEKQLSLFKKFSTDFDLTDEAKTWSSLYAIETYFYFIDDYSFEKKINPELVMPDFTKFFSPLTINKLINWKILNQRISRYRSTNIEPRFLKKYADLSDKIKAGDICPDSLLINFITSNSTDPILNQLLIANYYTNQFEGNIVDGFKKNLKLIHEVIREPFIYNSLYDYYIRTDRYINNPEIPTNLALQKIEGTSIEEMCKKILSDNKGKVIYIDCWATWCAPCKKAMPDSKRLMARMKDKDVSFIYICIDSEEKIWKRLLAEYSINEGQHILLNKQQSEKFRDVMNINGVPCYILLNTKGQIVEKGFNLHPGEKSTEEKILKLLSESK
jgi:thiol-disulfide isomerase/thioredoxin